MIKYFTIITGLLLVLVSCSTDTKVSSESSHESTKAEQKSTNTLSAGQSAAMGFCNCTHIVDSLERENCYEGWVEEVSVNKSISESEAKVMGQLMFQCNPEEAIRVILLIEE